MRTILLALVLLGCGRADDSKSADKSAAGAKPVEPSAEQKKACADSKQAAADAWKAYGASAKAIADVQSADKLTEAQKKADAASKETPDSSDARRIALGSDGTITTIDKRKAKVDATTHYLDALKASTAAYSAAVATTAKSALEVAGATRDAKPASDRASAAARDARDAAVKAVAAEFDDNNDGPANAIVLMKEAQTLDPSAGHQAQVDQTVQQVAAMQTQATSRHTDAFKLADAANAASSKIDDACKGIP